MNTIYLINACVPLETAHDGREIRNRDKGDVKMNWEDMKILVEKCVPEQLLKEYGMCIEISCAGTNANETRIEIDNSKCEIFVTES